MGRCPWTQGDGEAGGGTNLGLDSLESNYLYTGVGCYSDLEEKWAAMLWYLERLKQAKANRIWTLSSAYNLFK